MIRWSKTKILLAAIIGIIVVVLATGIKIIPTGRAVLIPVNVVDTNAFNCGWINKGSPVSLKFVSHNPYNDEKSVLLSSTTFDVVDVRHYLASTTMLKINFILNSVFSETVNNSMYISLLNGDTVVVSIKLLSSVINANEYNLFLKDNKFTANVTNKNTGVTTTVKEIDNFNNSINQFSINVVGTKGDIYFIGIEAWYTFVS